MWCRILCIYMCPRTYGLARSLAVLSSSINATYCIPYTYTNDTCQWSLFVSLFLFLSLSQLCVQCRELEQYGDNIQLAHKRRQWIIPRQYHHRIAYIGWNRLSSSLAVAHCGTKQWATVPRSIGGARGGIIISQSHIVVTQNILFARSVRHLRLRACVRGALRTDKYTY